MCLDICGCNRIVSSVGPTGATGATGAQGIQGIQGIQGAMPTTYNTTQPYSSTNDVYAAGAGYEYIVSNSMPAGTTCYYDITFLVAGTAATTITFYPIINGVPDTTIQQVVVMPTAISSLSSISVTLTHKFTYTAGQTFKIMVKATNSTGTPVLKTVYGNYYTVS